MSNIRVRTAVAWLIWTILGFAVCGCATTRFHERERLAHEAMRLDADHSIDYVRTKMEAAREGSLGRFGPVAAGGCGCQ